MYNSSLLRYYLTPTSSVQGQQEKEREKAEKALRLNGI
jgi:hypothetical protein